MPALGKAICIGLSASLILCAQLLQPTLPMPSFEVATVRRWTPSAVSPPQKVAKVAPIGAAAPISDPVHFIGQIELLIEAAYRLPISSGNRILGGPDWMRSESDRYEVIAKIGAANFGAIQKMRPAQQQEQVSWMEQSLLADRFKFRAHIETREMPRYALVLTKSGNKLGQASSDAKSQLSLVRNGSENELKATAVSVDELARSPFLRLDDRQIVNRTGLVGVFNFTLKFGARGNADGDAPELLTALQEQSGLKLVPETGPVEVVVIEHMERPSGN